MLLNVDGLNEPWDGTRMPKSDYEGPFGELEFDDLPLAMQRLFSPEEIRAYDTSVLLSSTLSAGTNSINNSSSDKHFSTRDVREVRHLSLNYFRGRLIEHFDIKFKAGEIKWPRSRGKQIISSADRDDDTI